MLLVGVVLLTTCWVIDGNGRIISIRYYNNAYIPSVSLTLHFAPVLSFACQQQWSYGISTVILDDQSQFCRTPPKRERERGEGGGGGGGGEGGRREEQGEGEGVGEGEGEKEWRGRENWKCNTFLCSICCRTILSVAIELSPKQIHNPPIWIYSCIPVEPKALRLSV